MVLVPEIKLIRTDTTLDLSQKAEKVCFGLGRAADERGAILGPRFTGWGKNKNEIKKTRGRRALTPKTPRPHRFSFFFRFKLHFVGVMVLEATPAAPGGTAIPGPR